MTECSLLNSEFNAFLFAPIGKERNEMLLSVLSALARLGVDPWQEAAQLDQLPKERAAERLASMIEDLPSGRWSRPESLLIAARLVQLLPSRTRSKAASGPAGSGLLQRIRSWALTWLFYAVLWALLVFVGHRPTPPATDHTDTPLTSATSAPQAPVQGSGLEPTSRSNQRDAIPDRPISSRRDPG